MITDIKSNLWFSYKQRRYHTKKVPQSINWIQRIIPQNALFSWSDEPEDWDWKGCLFTVIGMNDSRVRIVARRQKILNRTDRLTGNKVWLMLGLKVTRVSDIKKELYCKPVEHNPPNRSQTPQISRWAFHMDVQNSGDEQTHISDAVIWVESDDTHIPQELVEIHNKILQRFGVQQNSEIFDVDTTPKDDIFPVIYQPRVDVHNNYVCSIFWEKKQDEIVFSIVFNDEELNRAWFFDYIYRHVRQWKYGRKKDLESFSILLQDRKPVALKFPGIYSNDDDYTADNTHGDKKGWFNRVPARNI